MKRCFTLLLTLCLLLSISSPALADNVLRLPSSLKSIEEDAFRGDTSLDEVILGDGIESLGAGAFAESSLRKINLPDSLTEIDDTALPSPGTVTVTATEGTDAYNWAVDKGYIVPEGSVVINATNFPDDTFRAYVSENFDTEETGKGILSAAELAAVKSIDVHGMAVASLEGIEHFPALEHLECFVTDIKTLDLSRNPALNYVICAISGIEWVNISGCEQLLAAVANTVPEAPAEANVYRYSYGDVLFLYPRTATLVTVAIDAENFPDETFRAYVADNFDEDGDGGLSTAEIAAATAVYVSESGITTLAGLEHLNALEYLSCAENGLESLDVSANTALIGLDCCGNKLESLDLSHNAALEQFHCEGNSLTVLDFSSCPRLATSVNLGWKSMNEEQNLVVYDYDDIYGYYQISLPASARLVLPEIPGLAITETNFPDVIFRRYVAWNFDTDENGALSPSELAAVEEIDCSGMGFADLTGIKNFTALKKLNCGGGWMGDSCKLTELDVSGMTALEELDCNNGGGMGAVAVLKTLNVDGCTALKRLSCNGNNMTALNLSTNTALVELDCSHGQIEALDLSHNRNLTKLACDGNALTALNLSNNGELTELTMSQMELGYLDLSGNTKLAHVEGGAQAINISGCPILLAAYEAGMDENYERPDWLPDNVNVYGDGVMMIDNTTIIVTDDADIPLVAAFFPDETFCGYVAENFDDNSDSILSPSEIAAVKSIDVHEMGITDLTGVKNFTALTKLECSGTQLTALDVSGMLALEELYCNSSSIFEKGSLAALDVSGCPALITLECSGNLLTELDVSDNKALQVLYCRDNLLKTLDVTQNTALKMLFFHYNQINEVDLSENAALELLCCHHTNLSALDLSDIDALQYLYAFDSPLTSLTFGNRDALIEVDIHNSALTALDLSGVETLEYLWAGNCALTSLNVSGCIALKEIAAHHNPLNALNVSGCMALETLNCGQSELKSLDASGLTALVELYCGEGMLESLDVSGCTALKTLHCYNNPLAALDVSDCTALTNLDCTWLQVTELNLSRNIALKELSCGANFKMTSLDVSGCAMLETLLTDACALTALDVSHNPQLKTLSLRHDHNVTSLDLSKNTKLEKLTCYDTGIDTLDVSACPALVAAVKTGPRTDFEFDWAGEPGVVYGGEGEDYALMVDNDTTIVTVPAGWVEINAAIFPDETFRTFVLENFDKNGNGALSTAELAAVEEIDCSGMNIADLTGVKNFTALTKLDCSENQLTALDVSGMTTLKELNCAGPAYNDTGRLAALNVNGCSALWKLNCDYNQLPSLNVSSCAALTSLNCHGNLLDELDVTANILLEHLSCGGNRLTGLNLSKNEALTDLSCPWNQLLALDVSHNKALISLWVNCNQLSELNLGANTSLAFLTCYANPDLTKLDISACPALIDVYEDGGHTQAYLPWGAPDSGAGVVIYGDYQAHNAIFVGDETAVFDGAIEINETNFPDAAFRNNMWQFDQNPQDGKLSVKERNAVTSIYFMFQQDATSLQGIEFFPNLTMLQCHNCGITEIDLSHNLLLETLNINSNQLTTLDLSQNHELQNVFCSMNSLTELKLPADAALLKLGCAENRLTALDVSGYPDLTELSCGGNPLKTVDVSENDKLTQLDVGNLPELTTLNLSKNTALISLNISETGLESIALSGLKDLEELSCDRSALTALDVSQNTKLRWLSCVGIQTETLDLSQNPALIEVNCSGSQLTELSLGDCDDLTTLNCSGCQLTALTLGECPALNALDCSGNSLTKVNLSTLPALTVLSCGGNKLVALDVSENGALATLDCSNNSLSELDVSHNASLVALGIGGNPLTKLNCSHTQLPMVDVSGCPVLLAAAQTAGRAASWDASVTLYGGTGDDFVFAVNSGTDVLTAPVEISAANFPNQNFRAYVAQFDTDGDNKLSGGELAKVTRIQVDPMQITDFTGIAYFTGLTELNCTAWMGGGQIRELDISGLPALQKLWITNNQVTSLDLSHNPNLRTLDCGGNQLMTLDISHNPALTALFCEHNPLTSLDLSRNGGLKQLNCSTYTLSAVDISPCPTLVEAYLNTEPRVTSNGGGMVDWLEVAYGGMGMGQYDFTFAVCTATAVITSVEDDIPLVAVFFPDENFREYVRGSDGDHDDKLSFAERNAVTVMDVHEAGISSLAGIEYFPALTTLICYGNPQLQALDVSRNTQLTTLECGGTGIASLDISKCPNLVSVFMYAEMNNSVIQNFDLHVTVYQLRDESGEFHQISVPMFAMVAADPVAWALNQNGQKLYCDQMGPYIFDGDRLGWGPVTLLKDASFMLNSCQSLRVADFNGHTLTSSCPDDCVINESTENGITVYRCVRRNPGSGAELLRNGQLIAASDYLDDLFTVSQSGDVISVKADTAKLERIEVYEGTRTLLLNGHSVSVANEQSNISLQQNVTLYTDYASDASNAISVVVFRGPGNVVALVPTQAANGLWLYEN